jgi:hypothetical protein
MGIASDGCSEQLFYLFAKHIFEFNASILAILRARVVLPNGTWKQFPPLIASFDDALKVHCIPVSLLSSYANPNTGTIAMRSSGN